MYHDFLASQLDTTKCAHCKIVQAEHKCDICSNSTVKVELFYGNMLMCQECRDKEQAYEKEHMSPENQQKRVDEYKSDVAALVAKAKELDNSLQVRTDIFNAKTIAIIEVKAAIYNNPEIENKPYAYAQFMAERFENLKKVIFEANQTVIDASNEQKALQVQLNQIANELRAEEREKLKIADINYKPSAPKIAKPTAIKTKSAKLDKVAIRNAALNLSKELGKSVPEYMIQMLVVQQNISIEQATDKLRKTLREGQSEAS